MFCGRCQNSQLQSCLLTCFSPQHRMWKVPPGGHQGWKWSRWEPLDLPIHSFTAAAPSQRRDFVSHRPLDQSLTPVCKLTPSSPLWLAEEITNPLLAQHRCSPALPSKLIRFLLFFYHSCHVSVIMKCSDSFSSWLVPSIRTRNQEKKNIQILFFFICTDHTAKKQNKQRFITTAPRNDRRVASLSWRSVLMWAFPCFWKHLRARLTWRFSPSSVWSTLRRHRGGGAQ